MADDNTHRQAQKGVGKKHRSDLWRLHFDREEDDKGMLRVAVCRYCRQRLRGSASDQGGNFWKHINNHCKVYPIWVHFQRIAHGSAACKKCRQNFGPDPRGDEMQRHYRECTEGADAAAVAAPGAAAPMPVTALETEQVMDVEQEEEGTAAANAARAPVPPSGTSGGSAGQEAAAVGTTPPAPPGSLSSELDAMEEDEEQPLLTPPCAPSAAGVPPPGSPSLERDSTVPDTEQEAAAYVSSSEQECGPDKREVDFFCEEDGRIFDDLDSIIISDDDDDAMELGIEAFWATTLALGPSASRDHMAFSAEKDKTVAPFSEQLPFMCSLPWTRSIVDEMDELCHPALAFDQERKGMLHRLEHRVGWPSVAVNKGNTIHGKFLYTACQFIDAEWNLRKVVLDASMLVPDPSLCGQLLSIPEDDLANYSDYFACHAIEGAILKARDIIAGSILLMACELRNDPWINGYTEINFSNDPHHLAIPGLLCTTYMMDNVLHSIARCLSVPDLRDVCTRLRHHGFMDRQERAQLLSDGGPENLWEYTEPWYLCYRSLEVLRTKDSISNIEQMFCNLWGAVHHAIKTISTSWDPTSHLCLVELFKVREALVSEEEAAHKANDARVEGVIRKAKAKLDTALRASYLVWSISFVLDPRKKLDSVRLIFDRVADSDYYQCSAVEEATYKLYRFYYPYESHATIDLDRYLAADPVPQTEDFDILSWWKLEGARLYPKLAGMAAAVLAMPTSSKLSSHQFDQVKSILGGSSPKKHLLDLFLATYEGYNRKQWPSYFSFLRN
ncbi:hypothetical protein ACP4OV_018257 [Aristida adscensionis]